jgi:signal transduction histidine kinase/ligand-binding sensor domain-containing protein
MTRDLHCRGHVIHGARATAAAAGLLFATLVPSAGAEQQFDELGAGRGLTASVVHAVLIDSDGLLWVGSREGLFRYDGYEATAMLADLADPGGASELEVRALYEADDGALWIGTLGGGLVRRDPLTGRTRQYGHDPADPRSLSDPNVLDIAQDGEGYLWVTTRNGLNRLDADLEGFTRYHHVSEPAPALGRHRLSRLLRSSQGRLWIATHGAGVERWDAERQEFETYSLAQLAGGSPGLDSVFAIAEARGGRLWVGTREGLLLLDPLRREARLVKLARSAGPEPFVAALHVDRFGRLWIGTLTHGLMVAEQPAGNWPAVAQLTSTSVDDSSPALQTLSLVSNHDSILVGTWGGGVLRAPIADPGVRLLTRKADGSGLRNKSVSAVLGTATAGQPWVGTLGPERVDVTTGTVIATARSESDPMRRTNVLSLAVTEDGEHFAGTATGLYRFGPDGESLDDRPTGLDNATNVEQGYIRALLPAGGRGLWVGSSRVGLVLRDPGTGRFSRYSIDTGPNDQRAVDYVTALARGSDNWLWVGTRVAGLRRCRIQPWSCELISEPARGHDGLGRQHVTALRYDPAGALWVATDGGGLFRVSEGDGPAGVRFERWGKEQGLLGDAIMSIEQDSDGTLWLGTREGLSRLDPATGNVANLIVAAGLPAGTFNAGASSADAEFLYFGSSEGLVSIRKGSRMPVRPPTPVRITTAQRSLGSSRVALGSAELATGFKLRAGENLDLQFAVLDFFEMGHDYEYRLNDGVWIPLGQSRGLTVTGPQPGRYQLEVRGRDAFGRWNSCPPLVFEVVPPLWKNVWFRAIALAITVLLLATLHLLRLRGLRRRNAALVLLQRQREDALERANRSQRELEEASAGLRQLTSRLESAEEEARSRISRELHDEFGQTLTAAKINLQMLRSKAADPAVVQRLDDSVGMVDRLIRQARDIARSLRPSLLDEAGLVPALDDHLKALAKRSDVRIDFDADPFMVSPPKEINTTVFRVIQEAVSNALRHAHASTIRVAVREESQTLSVVIEDDGVGFDPEAVGQRVRRGEHLGMLGMTERVRSVRGTIEFDSRPGAGSRIRIRIPRPGAAPGPDVPSR